MLYRKFKKTTEKWLGGYDSYRVNYMIYICGGLWALPLHFIRDSKWLENSYITFFLALCVYYTSEAVAMVDDVYTNFRDIERVLNTLSTSIFFFGGSWHMILLSLRKVELKSVLDCLTYNFYLKYIGKSEADLKILESGHLELRKVSIAFYHFVAYNIIMRVLVCLIPEEKSLHVPYPYVPEVTPYFEMIFWLQTIFLTHFCYVVVASELVIYGILIAIRKQFEILIKNFSDITNMYLDFDESNRIESEICLSSSKQLMMMSRLENEKKRSKSEETTKKLKELIVHHQNILNIIRRVNILLKETLFAQLVLGGTFLAILILDVFWKSKRFSIKMVPQGAYGCTFIVNSSILCSYGTQLENKSKAAALALYDTPWYEMDIANRKTLNIFLNALHNFPKIRGGGMFPINNRTFLRYVQLIYNAVAFIKNFV